MAGEIFLCFVLGKDLLWLMMFLGELCLWFTQNAVVLEIACSNTTCILFCCGTSENIMAICKGVKQRVLVRGGHSINYPPLPNVLCLW